MIEQVPAILYSWLLAMTIVTIADNCRKAKRPNPQLAEEVPPIETPAVIDRSDPATLLEAMRCFECNQAIENLAFKEVTVDGRDYRFHARCVDRVLANYIEKKNS